MKAKRDNADCAEENQNQIKREWKTMSSNNSMETIIEAVNGGFPYVLLSGKSDYFTYVNNQRSNAPTGKQLDVCLQGNKMKTISIKVEGADPLPDVSDEQITNLCKQKKYLYVKLHDCVVTLKSKGGFNGSSTLQMSAVAKGAEIVDESKVSPNSK